MWNVEVFQKLSITLQCSKRNDVSFHGHTEQIYDKFNSVRVACKRRSLEMYHGKRSISTNDKDTDINQSSVMWLLVCLIMLSRHDLIAIISISLGLIFSQRRLPTYLKNNVITLNWYKLTSYTRHTVYMYAIKGQGFQIQHSAPKSRTNFITVYTYL